MKSRGSEPGESHWKCHRSPTDSQKTSSTHPYKAVGPPGGGIHYTRGVDRCDAQSAKPRAGTPARDPRPATRVETSVRTLYVTVDVPYYYYYTCSTTRRQGA
eukprot:7073111-Prymnesium_polylepis.1